MSLVIFDLDGVLLDTRELHYEALNQALIESPPPPHNQVISLIDHHTRFDGLSTYEKLQILVEERGLPLDLAQKVAERKQELTQIAFRRLRPNPRIKELLKSIVSRGWSVAIATNSVRSTLEIALDRLEVSSLIELSLSNEDVRNPKPHPEIYWSAMSHFGCLPGDTVIVEDSPIGLASAQASGARVLVVDSPAEIGPELLPSIVDLPHDLAKLRQQGRMSHLQVLIPMAGRGSRFEDAGYTFPKPLIEVHGVPMIEAVVKNLNVAASWVFAIQSSHDEKFNLGALLKGLVPDSTIVRLAEVTGGAAETAISAFANLDPAKPLLLANSDQLVDWDIATDLYRLARMGADGGIWTFRSNHPKWSFAKLSEDSLWVTEVAEKRPISSDATAGIYYWRRAGDFVRYAQQMIEAGDTTNGEFYVCPAYNWAIRDQKKIAALTVGEMHGLGTPEDLDYFLSLGRARFGELVG